MAQKLLADDLADLSCADHFMHLLECRPLDAVGFSRLQHDPLQRHIFFKAIMVVESIPVPNGDQQFKFLCLRPDTGFFFQLPDDSSQAVLPRLGAAAGILPGAGKTLLPRAAGQQNPTFAGIDPNADHQAVFPRHPGRSTTVQSAGYIPEFVINIIIFYLHYKLCSR